MIRIFFDVDGVLIDGFHANPKRWNRWDKNLEQDLGIKPEQLQQIFSGWFLEVQQGKADLYEEMDGWLKSGGHTLSAQELIDYWHKADSKLTPAFEVVERLSRRDGIALYTATNQNHHRMRYLKEDLGWQRHFTDFYYSARLGCLKHDARFFSQIEEELGADPRQEVFLYFDDDVRNIGVALARGWNAVLVDGAEDVASHPIVMDLTRKTA